MELSLEGKICVISGSGSGIGAQIERELSTAGATVVINYPTSDHYLEQQASAVVDSLRNPGLAVQADISTATGPRLLIEKTVAAYGKIDILINNAGIAVNLPFEEQTLKHWDQLVNLNGRGTFLLTQAALPHLATQGARIVKYLQHFSKRRAPYAGHLRRN